MLLEFRAKNYKTFKDELVFSMAPMSRQKGLEYSILKENAGQKSVEALCSAVIYGPNASGKTNIIGAMDAFKSIVLRGNIRNSSEAKNPDIAAIMLEMIPNNILSEPEPVAFGIKFTTNGYLVEYSFSMDIGAFMDSAHARKVLSEQLKTDGKIVFERAGSDCLNVHSEESKMDIWSPAYLQNAESALTLAKSSLNDEELFLMNGFRTICSPKLVTVISDWLKDRFNVVYRADAVQFVHRYDNPENKSVHVEKALNDATKAFGMESGAIGYVADDKGKASKLYSIVERGNSGNIAIPSEYFESYGTVRFANLFPVVSEALMKGGTLVVDEFDASIHPMALMSIINVFHNDEINVNRAQLIFNTHNPIFLNNNLFRRDEIKFVERDEETHCSTHYSLSDFGTAGKGGVRKDDDYMKGYFVDRYGAIRDVDFSPIFEEVLPRKGEVG